MFLDYDLPPHLIAQHPVSRRDASRLMFLDRQKQTIRHHQFSELPELLAPGDRLVLNQTRVLPARLLGRREKTGGQWEGLFLREREHGVWEMLAQTRGRPVPGERISIDGSELRLTLVARDDRHWLMKPNLSGSVAELLHRFGHIPLPPYIRKGRDEPEDRSRYQTVFAQADGSVAAPTAGLHFTEELFQRLHAIGIESSSITLHVGLGTFEPIRVADPREHTMHREWCTVDEPTVEAINRTRDEGGRIIAVGSTSLRTLESAAREGSLKSYVGETDLFVFPPFTFRVVQGLITNFHLPKSTLLLLVSAFAGEELIREAYRTAIREEYRFFSYGDAMLIV